MQKVLTYLSLILLLGFTSNTALAIYGDYEEFSPEEETINQQLTIPKGMFFRGFIGQTVSSEFNNNNDIIKILITSDFVLNDNILLPKNSLFIGTVKNLQKAQQGMDGTFAIDIIGLVYPDGRQFPAKGYIVSSGNKRTFGGNFSKRSGHKTTLHRSESFGRKGTMQLQQNGPRKIGKETKITMGDLVTFVLEEEINLN